MKEIKCPCCNKKLLLLDNGEVVVLTNKDEPTYDEKRLQEIRDAESYDRWERSNH